MKSAWLYRIAAILLVFFAAGHTVGFLTFKPPSVEGRAVLDAMHQVHFAMSGSSLSYGGFYVGFGLDVSLYLLFSAYLAWHLSVLAQRAPEAIGGLGWAFFGLQVGGLVLSLKYFALPPAVFSVVVVICLGWAMVALPKRPLVRK